MKKITYNHEDFDVRPGQKYRRVGFDRFCTVESVLDTPDDKMVVFRYLGCHWLDRFDLTSFKLRFCTCGGGL